MTKKCKHADENRKWGISGPLCALCSQESVDAERLLVSTSQSGWQIPASMVPPPPDTFTRQQVEAMLRVALTDRTDEWTSKSVDERVAALLAMFTKEKP